MKTCAHRGHALNDCGRCPYHGLQYPLKEDPFVVRGPMEATLFDLSVIEEIEEDFGRKFLAVEQHVAAPPFLWMENTMDPNHLKSVHPKFSAIFEDALPYDLRFSEDWVFSSYRMRVKKEVVKSYEEFFDFSASGGFLHITKFPNVSITNFLSLFYSVESVTPDGPGGCVVLTEFFDSRKRPSSKALLDAAKLGNADILREDKEIVESWAKTYRETKNWLPGEERIRAYERLLRNTEQFPVSRA